MGYGGVPSMSRTCMQLTSAELTALIVSGYTVSSGPHATEEDCLAACTGSDSESASESESESGSADLAT